MIQMLALAAEALFEVSLSNVSRVVNVEVMECKSHIGVCNSSPAINSDSKELTVVDFAIMVEINTLED